MNKLHSSEGKSYPNFQEEIIDEVSEDQFNWPGLIAFPFRVREKRKDDLVIFRPSKEQQFSEVVLYENPSNYDSNSGSKDVSPLSKWNRKVLAKVRAPTSCTAIEVSKNGFSDLVITTDYGEAPDAMGRLGGRSFWMENSATGESMWPMHDIGRFPGINLVKIGHFSTTFSTQLLTSIKSSDPGVSSPFVIFTPPEDLYRAKQWLVSVALQNTLHAVQDCFVVKGRNGTLDYLIVSSREGLSIVWYNAREWHHKLISSIPMNNTYTRKHFPGQIQQGRIGKDLTGFIVSASANKGSVLSLFEKQNFGDDPRSTTWTQVLLDDFTTDEESGSILDLLCVDLDKDDIDEIYVSVSGSDSNAGLYCYVYERGSFIKYKLSNVSVTKLTSGHFSSLRRLDLACISPSPQRLLLYNSIPKATSIRSYFENSELVFSIPRLPSARLLCETDILNIMGYTLSLVTLPPNSLFSVSMDGIDSIKVLHGFLGWVDFQSELIERSRAAGPPGCVSSMLVDSSDGHVRSGNDGAVFVRLRPSVSKNIVYENSFDSWKHVVNVVPKYYPYNVCEHRFHWVNTKDQLLSSTGKSSAEKDMLRKDDSLRLPGFLVRLDDVGKGATKQEYWEDLVYVYFVASAPNSASDFVKYNESPSSLANSDNRGTCSIRASLSNPGGDGGFMYCADEMDWMDTPPTSYQKSRARKVIVPEMYEHAPFWRAKRTMYDGDSIDGGTEIEYPWHSWVASRGMQKGEQRWDVWMAFDFPAFMIKDQIQEKTAGNSCIIS